MTPCFRSFILLQLWSHFFHIFHRGCHYLLRPNPMHWWRSTRHYTATCTTLSKSLSTTNTSSSRTLFEQMESKFFLTFTCTVADCGELLTLQFTKQAYRKGVVLVQFPGCNLKRVRRTASCVRDCWKRRGRRSEGASWILMGSERWRNILNEVKIWRIEQDAPGF